MKIYNYVRFDMDTGKTIEEDSFEYSGPVGLCQQDSGWGEPETGIDDPAGAWDTQNQAGHDIHDMIQEWEKAGYTWKEGLKDFAKVGVISPIAGVVYTAYRSYATGKERDAALSKGLKDIGFSDQQASNMQSQVRNQGWRNAINSISGGGDATPESYAMSGYTTGLNKDVFGNLQGRDWSMLSDKEWARRYSLNPEQARQAFRKYTNRGELPDSIIKLAEGLEGGRGAVGPTGEGTGTPTDGGGTYEAIVPGNDGSPITEASIKKYFNQILGRNPSAQEIQDRISQASTYGSDPTTPQNNNWLIRELSKSDEGKAYAARGGGGGGVGTPGAPPAPTGPPTAEEMYERYNMPGAATSGLVDRSSGWGSWDQSPQQQFTLTRQESGGFQAPPGAQQNAFTRQESGGFQAPPGATPKTGEPGPNALSPRAIPQTDAGPYQDARNVFDYSTGVIDTTMDRGMNAINRGVGQMRGDITTGMGQMRGDITTGMNQMMAEFTQAEQKAEAALKQALATGRGDVTTALQQVTQEMRPYGMAGEKALQNVMGMIKSGVPSMEEFRKSRTYQSPLEDMTQNMQRMAAVKGQFLDPSTIEEINRAAQDYGSQRWQQFQENEYWRPMQANMSVAQNIGLPASGRIVDASQWAGGAKAAMEQDTGRSLAQNAQWGGVGRAGAQQWGSGRLADTAQWGADRLSSATQFGTSSKLGLGTWGAGAKTGQAQNLIGNIYDKERLGQGWSNAMEPGRGRDWQQNVRMPWEADQGAIDREWRGGQSEADRNWRSGESEADRAWREREAERNRQFGREQGVRAEDFYDDNSPPWWWPF